MSNKPTIYYEFGRFMFTTLDHTGRNIGKHCYLSIKVSDKLFLTGVQSHLSSEIFDMMCEVVPNFCEKLLENININSVHDSEAYCDVCLTSDQITEEQAMYLKIKGVSLFIHNTNPNIEE